MTSRITAIDTLRGIAILLAMLSHAILQFADGNLLGELKLYRSLVTRTATPTFLILFGIMIELIYLQRLRDNRTSEREALARIYSRGISCYVYFVLIALAAGITAKIHWTETFEAALFLNAGAFGTILQVYAALFVLIGLTLPFAKRYGSPFYFGWAIIGWALIALLNSVGTKPVFLFQYFIGYGEGYGPSILPAFALVAFGLMIGEAISGKRSWAAPAILFAGSLLLTLYGFTSGLGDYAFSLVAKFRWTNDIRYYAFGIASVGMALLFLKTANFSWEKKHYSIATLGKDTMFLYGGGNIVLSLLPTYDGSKSVGAFLIAVFLIGLVSACFWKDQLIGPLRKVTRWSALTSPYERVKHSAVRGIVNWQMKDRANLSSDPILPNRSDKPSST